MVQHSRAHGTALVRALRARPQLKYRFTARVREARVHADGTARAQLFLIRALQGYQLPSKGQRVHNEASRRAIIQRFNIIQCNLFLETILFIAVQTSILYTLDVVYNQ